MPEIGRGADQRLGPEAGDQVELAGGVVVAGRQQGEAVVEGAVILEPPAAEHGERQGEKGGVAAVETGPAEHVAIGGGAALELAPGLGMELLALARGAAGGEQHQRLGAADEMAQPGAVGRLGGLVGDEVGLLDRRHGCGEVLQAGDPVDVDAVLAPAPGIEGVGGLDVGEEVAQALELDGAELVAAQPLDDVAGEAGQGVRHGGGVLSVRSDRMAAGRPRQAARDGGAGCRPRGVVQNMVVRPLGRSVNACACCHMCLFKSTRFREARQD